MLRRVFLSFYTEGVGFAGLETEPSDVVLWFAVGGKNELPCLAEKEFARCAFDFSRNHIKRNKQFATKSLINNPN